MIETEGLSKYYGDFIAVEDLSFSIKRGEVVAIKVAEYVGVSNFLAEKYAGAIFDVVNGGQKVTQQEKF